MPVNHDAAFRLLAKGSILFAGMAAMCAVVAAPVGETDAIQSGARLAHDVAKGNCLACHAMPSDPAAVTSANIGPPLLSMRARFPDRERLRRQVWNAGSFNPETVMPPFGKNHVLTSEEIDLILDYLYTL